MKHKASEVVSNEYKTYVNTLRKMNEFARIASVKRLG